MNPIKIHFSKKVKCQHLEIKCPLLSEIGKILCFNLFESWRWNDFHQFLRFHSLWIGRYILLETWLVQRSHWCSKNAKGRELWLLLSIQLIYFRSNHNPVRQVYFSRSIHYSRQTTGNQTQTKSSQNIEKKKNAVSWNQWLT